MQEKDEMSELPYTLVKIKENTSIICAYIHHMEASASRSYGSRTRCGGNMQVTGIVYPLFECLCVIEAHTMMQSFESFLCNSLVIIHPLLYILLLYFFHELYNMEQYCILFYISPFPPSRYMHLNFCTYRVCTYYYYSPPIHAKIQNQKPKRDKFTNAELLRSNLFGSVHLQS